ncbi:MAG: MarR family winged helix-turn-helix transcriptional regulator [Sphingobacteriaceae bacterium]
MEHQETIDFYMKVVWQNMANKYNQLAAAYGITQAIGYLLINIDEEEGTTVSRVAALLGLKSTSLSRMLNSLEKMNLIYRETGKEDKRLVRVYLTDLGKEKRHIARGVVRGFNDYLDANLEEEDKSRLTRLLKKVNALTVDYQP